MRVYNRFLDLLVETDSYQSFQYGRNFHGVGTFEIHINRYMHGAEHFQKGNIIALNKQENKAGIIVSKEIVLGENGKASESFKLTGTTLNGIMNRRETLPPNHTSHDRRQGDAETVMKHYVYNNFVNPADPKRKIDILEIAPNKNRGNNVVWESRYKDVGDELEKISLESGLGWLVSVNFNTKKLVFDCFIPKDLTQGNSQGNSPVFFSPEFETIKSQSFVDSDAEYKNVGYVGGQGEGVDRKIIELGDASGWERVETFVDARDVGTGDEESEEELTDEEIERLLIDRGKKKMKEMETLLSFEAEILTPITRKSYEYTVEGFLHPTQNIEKQTVKNRQITPFQYEKDFDLGDFVQVVNKSWGLTMRVPIVEITEIHEPGGFKLEATFGEARPTIQAKLKNKFDEIEKVEKQEAVYRRINEVESILEHKVDNVIYPNNRLWMGSAYPLSGYEVKPSKKLTDCRNGWLLKWQRYVVGEGISNNNFSYDIIPKNHLSESEGSGVGFLVRRDNEVVHKYLYVYNDKLVGQIVNEEGINRTIVLTGVYEW